MINLLRTANRELEERFKGTWRQSEVSIELAVRGEALYLYPYDLDSDEHSRIDERSDGFRSFLAMLSFAARQRTGILPILLIDEAERHLHYDAQADLVAVFARQQFASQVIYTTHSAGCLPEDLGTAVRVVATLPQARSEVRNSFWSRGQAGFTPLLLAMGASALAFTPSRRALLAEGPSDAVLLPAMLRTALGLRADHPLGFQIAPGLAWVANEELPRLDLEAARVAYLVDSDDGGRQHRERLIEAGVDPNRILQLSPQARAEFSIEDLVHADTYLAAVNHLVRNVRDSDAVMLAKDLPERGRASAVDRWCTARGIDSLSRVAVAEEILRRVRPVSGFNQRETEDEEGAAGPPPSLLAPKSVARLQRLHERLSGALKLDEDPLSG